MTMKTEVIKSDKQEVVTVTYGLQKLAGNKNPYFSITGEVTTPRGKFISGGCIHETIMEITDKFDDLIALHLCGDDGAPMYALDNGFHFYAEGIGLNGEPAYHKSEEAKKEYEAQCKENAFDKFAQSWQAEVFSTELLSDVWNAVKGWSKPEEYDSYLFRDAVEAKKEANRSFILVNARNNEALAKHLRISQEEAEAIPAGLTKEEFNERYIVPNLDRWKREADAAISKYGLA